MLDLFSPYGQIKDVRMIKDKNSLNDSFKSYAFIEFFDLEDAKKALDALGKGEIKLREEKGEIKLREETLCGNYSTKTEDKNNNNFNYENNLNYIHGVNIFIIIYNLYIYLL